MLLLTQTVGIRSIAGQSFVAAACLDQQLFLCAPVFCRCASVLQAPQCYVGYAACKQMSVTDYGSYDSTVMVVVAGTVPATTGGTMLWKIAV
jgi:hypothetical protein